MTHWNHRVVKEILTNGEDWYSVREVFYNSDGSIYAYTSDPVDICGGSIDEMRQYIQRVLDSLSKPVLIDSEVVFSDGEPKGE